MKLTTLPTFVSPASKCSLSVYVLVIDFRAQVEQLELVVDGVPQCVMSSLLNATLKQSMTNQEYHSANFSTIKDELNGLKVSCAAYS